VSKQRSYVNRRQPLRLRAINLACLLLVLVASCLQAAHIHGDWLPHHSVQLEKAATSGELPGSEETCPLCVAMHSALPFSARVALVSLTVVEVRIMLVTDRLPNGQWHYARFGRPPPALNS
jgi:hypothetical protein